MDATYQLLQEYTLKPLLCDIFDGTYRRYLTFRANNNFIIAFACEWAYRSSNAQMVTYWSYNKGVMTNHQSAGGITYPIAFRGTVEGVMDDIEPEPKSLAAAMMQDTPLMSLNNFYSLQMTAGFYNLQIPAVLPGEIWEKHGVGLWVYEKNV